MDYLVPVAKKDLGIAQITIKSILIQDNEARIIVVTNKQFADNFIGARIEVLDEDKLIKSLNFKAVQDIIIRLSSQSKGTGWYFQQFIKMAYALIAERNYVVWDSDTVMLKKFNFLQGGKYILYYNDVNEHSPYLITMKKLLPNIEIINDISFVTEKMLIDFKIMQEIIHSIESKFGYPFFRSILENIEDSNLLKSGFSEFATYANYVICCYPNNYQTMKTSHFRSGTKIFGKLPDLDDLKFVAIYYDSISFEKWHKQNRVIRNISKFLFAFKGVGIYNMYLFMLMTFIYKYKTFKKHLSN